MDRGENTVTVGISFFFPSEMWTMAVILLDPATGTGCEAILDANERRILAKAGAKLVHWRPASRKLYWKILKALKPAILDYPQVNKYRSGKSNVGVFGNGRAIWPSNCRDSELSDSRWPQPLLTSSYFMHSFAFICIHLHSLVNFGQQFPCSE